MIEPTEREQKLLQYLSELIMVLSAYAYHFQGIVDGNNRLMAGLQSFDMVAKEDALLKFLADEFDIHYKVTDTSEKEE